jgi:hypothetical protein
MIFAINKIFIIWSCLNIFIGKCPSYSSEGDDRLSKTNDTKFEFIAKEEEECDFCVNIMWEKRDVLRVNNLHEIKYKNVKMPKNTFLSNNIFQWSI